MAIEVMQGQAAKRQPSPRVAAVRARRSGFDEPPQGSFDTYRLMRASPTIALTLAAIKAPVKATAWTYEADDDTPDEWVAFVQRTMDRLKHSLVTDALRMIEYGFAAFERVWAIDPDAPELLTYAKSKSLLQDITKPIIDEHGNLIAVENAGTALGVRKFAWFAFDQEGDDHYGRSLLENVRRVWSAWDQTLDRIGSYIRKNAGVIPWVKYPPGRTAGRDGTERDNWEHADALLSSLAAGNGILMPNMLSDYVADAVADMVNKNINPESFLAWQVGFYESKSGAGAEMLANLQHLEALQVRGLLRPERSLLEGTNGTLAEAVVHTDTGLNLSEDLSGQIVTAVNAQYVNDLLEVNFGRAARGKVRIKAAPLANDDKAFFRDVTKAVLTNPANIDLLTSVTDIDAMLDSASWPKRTEVVNIPTATPTPTAPSPTPSPTPDPSTLTPAARALARAVEAARQIAAAAVTP